MKKITKDDIQWKIEIVPTSIPIDGDPHTTDLFKKMPWMKDKYQAEVDRGNLWIWGKVIVTGTYNGLEASSIQDGASFLNEQDFKDCGVYSDLQFDVIYDLNEKNLNQDGYSREYD